MRVTPSDLWRLGGTVDRSTYAFWGFLLVAFKFNLDRLIAATVFDRKWTIFNYVESGMSGGVLGLDPLDMRFYGTMVALALPFIYTGVALTSRRLRDVGLPQSLVLVFFVPLVNLLFFLVLAVLPGQAAREETPVSHSGPLRRLIPQSAFGSAALGVLAAPVVGVAFTLLAVAGLGEYGWGLFVGVPFCIGLMSVLIYGCHRPRTYVACLGVASLSVLILSLMLVAIAVEGLICLAMAAPIGIVLAGLGGTVGYFIQRSPGGGQAAPQVLMLLCLCLPVLMGAEARDHSAPPVFAVTTEIDIDAPPEVVWRNVVAFSELPKPTDWFFNTGVAYPMRARIDGHGVGAVRRCEFSTGPFVEPITVWDAPRLLKFDVTSQPPAMKELSPYANVDAPHLDDYLVSQGGQFALTRLPSGRTHLAGTTWYRHNIWPAMYWKVWSDAILHRIHGRVLAHVKALSEQ